MPRIDGGGGAAARPTAPQQVEAGGKPEKKEKTHGLGNGHLPPGLEGNDAKGLANNKHVAGILADRAAAAAEAAAALEEAAAQEEVNVEEVKVPEEAPAAEAPAPEIEDPVEAAHEAVQA